MPEVVCCNCGEPAISFAPPLCAKCQANDKCLCPDFELRGAIWEIWTDPMNPSNRCLVDPRTNEVVDTDHVFSPPLTNEELLSIYDYGKDW